MDGTNNRVADCLSHYYEADGPEDHHPDHDFMSADTKLNPDGELLPVQRYVELRSAAARRSHCLAEHTEQRVLDSVQLNAKSSPIPVGPDNDDSPLAIRAGANGQSLHTRRTAIGSRMHSAKTLSRRPRLCEDISTPGRTPTIRCA